jgi:hypothetical protein
MKIMGRDAPPGLQMEMVSYMRWHMAYHMLINHVALRSLVSSDKPVELIWLLDGNGDPQENVVTTVREIMIKHKVAHFPLWQEIFQNNNGSWRGFYPNGKGCERHKGNTTKWSSCIAAHLRFHLLKQGITYDSALELIWKSFTPEA